MSMPFHPVFPVMGWSCIKCRRDYSYYQLPYGCAHCPKEPKT